MSVQHQIAIVTGGASGIGRACAALLGKHGAQVIVADRDQEQARAACEEIRNHGGSAIDMACDVSDAKAVGRLVAHTKGTFGRIDVLVHAAGICPRKPFLEMTDEDWRGVLNVNLDGTFYITRDVARVMSVQRSGTMILITSDRGVHGSIDYAHYAASKGGMIALTKSLALTMGQFGVTVNAVNPGLTDTPLGRAANPAWQEKMAIDVLGKVSEPADVAAMVLFLAGTGGAFMTGQIVGARMRYGA
ncbi:MAG: SDR family oxidoreductase [Betaproteobacteria bacterium]|nr:SDR family oxidoreductase [Betaproteobacteria bacterium]